jgi:hypothetical protein
MRWLCTLLRTPSTARRPGSFQRWPAPLARWLMTVFGGAFGDNTGADPVSRAPDGASKLPESATWQRNERSKRPRHSVREQDFSAQAFSIPDEVEHEPQRQLLGQRRRRELFRDAQKRVDPQSRLSDTRSRAQRCLRVHGAPTSFLGSVASAATQAASSKSAPPKAAE